MTKNILKIFIANFLYLFNGGIAISLYPSILKLQGIPESLIGISAVTHFGIGLVVAPFMSKLSHHIGARNIIIFTTIIYAIAILFLPNYTNFPLWILLIALIGICVFSYLSLGASIFNGYVKDEKRGFYIALNTTIFCSGLAGGSFLVRLLGVSNYYLVVVASILAFIISFIYLSLPCDKKERDDTEVKEHKKIMHFLHKRPEIFLGKFFQEYMSGTIFAFIVVFGINNGFTAEASAIFVSAYAFSGILDIGVGFFSDKINRIKMISIGVFLSIINFYFIYHFAANYNLLCIFIFLQGILSAAIYINSASEANSFFAKKDLVGVNATLSAMIAGAGIMSGLLGGVILQFFGNIGIFLPVLIIGLLYFLIDYLLRKKII